MCCSGIYNEKPLETDNIWWCTEYGGAQKHTYVLRKTYTVRH